MIDQCYSVSETIIPFSWRAPVSFAVLMFVMLATKATSQAQITRHADTTTELAGETVVKHVQEVDVALTVKNRRGHLVSNITQSQLLILDNGERVHQIIFFETRPDLPLHIAVVVDRSASETCCLQTGLKTAANFLKHNLHPDRGDTAMMVTFNENVSMIQPPTADLHLLQQSLRGLRASGQTAIYDAISTASQELGEIADSKSSRRVIVVITDGEDNSSHITLQQAAEIALANEITIYVITTNSSGLFDVHGDADKAMQGLATETGGASLTSDGDIVTAFGKIEKELRRQYVLGYKPPCCAPNGQFHSLTILGPKGLRFFHRTGYFAR